MAIHYYVIKNYKINIYITSSSRLSSGTILLMRPCNKASERNILSLPKFFKVVQ